MRVRSRLVAASQLGVAAALAAAGLTVGPIGVAADPLRTATSIYEVAPGDTLSGIAVRFGIDVDTIVHANKLRSADRILPGETLFILPVSGVAYRVEPGDTLLGIAVRHQVEVAAVLEWNGLEDANHIVIGSELVLPGGKAPSAPVAARVAAPPTPPRPVAEAAASSSEATEAGESFLAKITAYSPNGGGASSPRTASGTPVRWGVLAVDPRVIPLGSRVAIEGFDEIFTAEDTGGAVRGAHVEIFYNDYTSAIRFGVQTRRVTILD